MRRALLVLLFGLIALDGFAAVPKVAITGKVIAPDGLTYAGSINCVMSAPATAMDGGTSVRVQSTGTLTIASDGTVSGSLVANDITTPVTSYTCTTRINRTPVYTQTELIYLTTGSGTVDWGAISRPGATPYTPVGVAGSSGAVQASNGSGGLADSGVTATAGALTAKKLDGITYANAAATAGAGTAVSPWTGYDTVVQTAVTACETVYFPPGYYAPSATLNFAPGCLKEAVVAGNSARIALSASVPRAFGFAKLADYDTFQNIDLGGFIIDGGNATGKGAAIIGTNVAGSNLTRVQFKNIYVHDIYAFNVKQDSNVGTNHMGFIQFSPQTTGSESEVLDFENVVIERVTMAGGNWGVLFTGNATNPSKERLSGITVRDCSVDMRPVGAQIATGYYAGTGFHFGGYALGESLTVENLTVYAPPDNCYEFNNWQTVIATALRCVNPMATGFTIKNFTAPTDFKQQRITITNAPVEMTVATPADPDGDGTPQYAPSAFTVTTAASAPMGDVIIRGGEFRQTTGMTTRVGPLVWVAPGASGGIRSVTLDDFKIAAPDMTRDSTQDQYWYPIYWQNKKYDYDGDGTADRPTLSVRNLDVKINLKKSASGVTAIRGAIGMIEGDANLDYRNVSSDIASNTTNDISGLYIVPGSAAEVSGTVRGYRYRGVDASASVNRYIWAGSTTNLTIADTLLLTDVRSTNGVASIDATQAGKINVVTDASASGTVVLANGSPANKVKTVPYDSNGDGTIDYMEVGDYDGDGTLTISDIQSALCALQGGTVAGTGGGNAGDESTCTGATRGNKTLRILPGTYTGTFRQELLVSGDGITIRGSGRDATVLQIGGSTTACGQAGSVDDGDGVVETRNLFRVSGDNAVFSDFTVDGSSQRWAYTQPKYRNAYDCDGNGVQGDTNDCANSCTKDVHDLFMLTDTSKNVTFTNVAFKNADGRAIQGDSTSNTCNGTEQRDLTVTGCLFQGAAEHAITAQFDRVSITGNIFEDCSTAYCVHLYEGSTDVTVTGNVFREFSGAAVGREVNGGTVCSPSASKRFVVSNNTMTSTTAPTATPVSSGVVTGIGAITFLTDADEAFSDIAITGNVIDITGSYHNAGISVGQSGTAGNSRIAITGNTIKFAPANGGVNRQQAGILYAADGGVISANVIDVTGDGTGAAAYFENGVIILSARDVAAQGNTVIMRGVGVVGYYIYDSRRTITTGSQIVDYADATSTAVNGVLLSGTSTAACFDNVLSGIHYSYIGVSSANTTVYTVGANCANNIVESLSCYNNGSWCFQNYGTGTIVRNMSLTGSSNNVYEGGTAVHQGNVYRSSAGSTTGGYNSTVYADHGFDMLVDADGNGTLDTNSVFRLLSATNAVRYQGATAGQYTDLKFGAVSGAATATIPNKTGTVAMASGATGAGVVAYGAKGTQCGTICTNAGFTGCNDTIKDTGAFAGNCTDTTGTTYHACLCY